MEKTAILFSGQGSQYSGMGLDLYQKDALFHETLDRLNSYLSSFDLLTVLANEKHELDQTKFQQPAIVAVSLGLQAMVQRDLPDLPVAGLIGLSLGEYAALISAGAMTEEEGMQALEARASLMQVDASQEPSAMAAVLKPDVAAVEAICTQLAASGAIIAVSNYNSPKQIVLGGQTAVIQQAIAEITEQGAAKRVVELPVSGAFHTQLFQTASEKMAPILAKLTVSEPQIPVISNTTGKPFEKERIAETLVQQIVSPTHFADCVSYLVKNEGVEMTLELGPGGTLTQFVKQIDRKIKRQHVEDYDSYQVFLAEMRGN